MPTASRWPAAPVLLDGRPLELPEPLARLRVDAVCSTSSAGWAWPLVAAAYERAAVHPASEPTRRRALRARLCSCEPLWPKRLRNWCRLDASRAHRYRTNEYVRPRASSRSQDICVTVERHRSADTPPLLISSKHRCSIETSTESPGLRIDDVHRLLRCARRERIHRNVTVSKHPIVEREARHQKVISNLVLRSCVSYNMAFFDALRWRTLNVSTSNHFRSLSKQRRVAMGHYSRV